MRIRLIFGTLARTPLLTLFKVLSLGLGLAMSSFLLIRVAHEESFDSCWPDADRLYTVRSTWVMDGKEPQTSTYVIAGCKGGMPEAMRENMSDLVDDATGVGGMMGSTAVAGDREVPMFITQADANILALIGIPMTEGEAIQPDDNDGIYLSESKARELFGNEPAVGKTLTWAGRNGFTVRGVWPDLPEESSLGDGAFSGEALSTSRPSYNHSMVLMRVKPGVDTDELNRRLNELSQSLTPDNDHLQITLEAVPLRDIHRTDPKVHQLTLTMSILAGAILFVTALNYVLLCISGLARRAKAVGVQKVGGATGADIAATFALETALLMLGALMVTAAIFFAVKYWLAETAVHQSVIGYANVSRLWILAAVLALIMLLGAVIPGLIMARIPVRQVFTTFREKHNGWKHTLLFVEMAGSALTLGVAVTVMAQYNTMLGTDIGFDTEHTILLESDMFDVGTEVSDAIGQMPEVRATTRCGEMPGIFYNKMSMLADKDGQRMSQLEYAQMDVQPNFFEVMEIPLIEGAVNPDAVRCEQSSYSSGDPRADADAVVTRSFAEMMEWPEGERVGREFQRIYDEGVLQHYRVIGVIDDMRAGDFFTKDYPSFFYFSGWEHGELLLKLNEPFRENLESFTERMARDFPDISVVTYQSRLMREYADADLLCTLTAVGAALVLFLTLVGIVAYVRDEVQRRAAEMRIRRIHGAETFDVVELQSLSVLRISAVAIPVGLAGAWLIGRGWLEQFTVTATGLPWMLGATGAVLLIVTMIVTMLQVIKIR